MIHAGAYLPGAMSDAESMLHGCFENIFECFLGVSSGEISYMSEGSSSRFFSQYFLGNGFVTLFLDSHLGKKLNLKNSIFFY